MPRNHQGFLPVIEPTANRRLRHPDARRIRPAHCLTVSVVATLLMIIVFGLSAWNVDEHRFGTNRDSYLAGDEVAMSDVANDFSSTFCQGYKITLQGPGQAYLLPHSAIVNTTYTDDTPVDIQQLPYRGFNVKYLYLLRGSSVNVTACRNNAPVSPEAEIVLIQGDSNFKRWRRNGQCDDCILHRQKIPDYAYCNDTSRRLPRLYQKIERNDKYFLVIFNGLPETKHHLVYKGIHLAGVISRTHFDLADAEKVCHFASGSCFFDLQWKSTTDVVVKFGGNYLNNYRDNLTTQCQERVIFWVCLFGIVPLLCIIIILAIFGCFLCRRNSERIRDFHQEQCGERTRLLRDQDKRFSNQVPQNEENGRMAIQYT